MAHAEQFSVVPRRPPLHFAKVRQRHPLCGRSMHIASQLPLSALWSTDQSGTFAILQLVPDAVLAVPARLSLPDWVAMVHAGDMTQDREAIAAAIGLGAPFQVEFALRCPDGATRQVRLSGLPAAPGCYHGFITDLSAHHEALASARREAGEYRLLIENTTDLIAQADTAGNYLSISPSYESMMGWNPASVVGQPVIAFLHPDDRQHSAAALSSVLGGGVLPNVVEVRKRHRDGHYIVLGTKASAIIDPVTGQCVGAVMVSRDITRDKEMLRDFEERATHDALTGLPNRAWLNQHVDRLLAASTGDRLTAILFMDLNGFKEVNDTMGHAAGDVLLQLVSARLKHCMRPDDAVARLGGDEFVVAAVCGDSADARAIALRLIDALKAPFRVHGTLVHVGAAVGISLARGGAATTAGMLQDADSAMYAAKARGDGSFEIFQRPLTSP